MGEDNTADVTWALDNLDFPDCLFFSSSQSLTATPQQEALFGAALDGFAFLHEATITTQILQICRTAGPIKAKSCNFCVLLKAASLRPHCLALHSANCAALSGA